MSDQTIIDETGAMPEPAPVAIPEPEPALLAEPEPAAVAEPEILVMPDPAIPDTTVPEIYDDAAFKKMADQIDSLTSSVTALQAKVDAVKALLVL